MAISLTSDSKNNISMSLDSRDTGLTWDEATFTWDDAVGTWDVPGSPIIEDSKNNISLTLDNK